MYYGSDPPAKTLLRETRQRLRRQPWIRFEKQQGIAAQRLMT